MKLLLDENGNVVVRNGKPVYVHDDGKEIEFDAAGTAATISRLNKEAQTHREAKEAEIVRAKEFEAQLKAFEGLDAAASRKALETLNTIDQGKLIDSGKVDEVKAAAVKEYEARLKAATESHSTELGRMKADNEKLTGQLHNEVIGGSFARSKVIAEQLAIPADLVQAKFGNAFKVEDGKLVAVDATGNRMFSRSRPGELADFDEALGMLVEQYPHRDHIMKSSGASGSGASASAGRSSSNKGITREQFDVLTPAAKMAHIKAGNEITD